MPSAGPTGSYNAKLRISTPRPRMGSTIDARKASTSPLGPKSRSSSSKRTGSGSATVTAMRGSVSRAAHSAAMLTSEGRRGGPIKAGKYATAPELGQRQLRVIPPHALRSSNVGAGEKNGIMAPGDHVVGHRRVEVWAAGAAVAGQAGNGAAEAFEAFMDYTRGVEIDHDRGR